MIIFPQIYILFHFITVFCLYLISKLNECSKQLLLAQISNSTCFLSLSTFLAPLFLFSDLVENFDEASKDEAN